MFFFDKSVQLYCTLHSATFCCFPIAVLYYYHKRVFPFHTALVSGVTDRRAGVPASLGKLNLKIGPQLGVYVGINMFSCVLRSVFRWIRVSV